MSTVKEKKSKNRTKGFTLIEIILVVMIVGIVFLGIYGLFAQTIKYNTESRHEVIASNLAQEGIEMIRNIRDENIIKAASYRADPLNHGNELEINDGLSATCHPFFRNSDFDLRCNRDVRMEKNAQGWYQNCQSSGPPCAETGFYRRCDIVPDPLVGSGVKSITVTCRVCWESFAKAEVDNCTIPNGSGRMVTATSYLTDWQD